MRITSHDSIAMLHQKSPSSGHPFTYRQRNILQNRVYKFIVTEKTNILLRYLHQQWERKVYQVLNRYIIVNQIRIS
uniref:DET1-and DDB1-associated-like protein n=1 Tax=Daphnia magna TaxID=35525 RepID=A0A0P6G152_9CRUS